MTAARVLDGQVDEHVDLVLRLGGVLLGAAAARLIWEGGPQLRGERDTPEMVACFGGALPLVDLLEGPFADLARELFTPVQTAVVPRPRGKA